MYGVRTVQEDSSRYQSEESAILLFSELLAPLEYDREKDSNLPHEFGVALEKRMAEVSLPEAVVLLRSLKDLLSAQGGGVMEPLARKCGEDASSVLQELIRGVTICLCASLVKQGDSICCEAVEKPCEEGFKASAEAALSCAVQMTAEAAFETSSFEEIPASKILSERSTRGVFGVRIGSGGVFGDLELGKLLKQITILEKRRGLIDFQATSALYQRTVEDFTARYGAKGARLYALKCVIEMLETERLPASLPSPLNIPGFRLVETERLERFRAGVPAVELLTEDFEWIKSRRRVIVRSSAVRSEDWFSLGAGIYESVLLPEDPALEDYYQAVSAIDRSRSTDLAKRHLRSLGIDEDPMGLLLHEFTGDEDEAMFVYSHLRCRVPGLRDVIFQDILFDKGAPEVRDCTPVITRDEAIRECLFFGLSEYNEFLRTPVDSEIISYHHIRNIASIACFIDLLTGSPHQVELVQHQKRRPDTVQLRPLPPTWLEPLNITLPPEEQCLLTGDCTGAFNGTLDILGDDETNCERAGFVVIVPVMMGRQFRHWIDTRIPKEGVVYLPQKSRWLRGHVETRCLERGVCLICDSTTMTNGQFHGLMAHMHAAGLRSQPDGPYIINPGLPGLKIESVSDGIRTALLAR